MSSSQPVRFLLGIWRKQCLSGDTVFLSTKGSSGEWSDHSFTYGTNLEAKLKEWFKQYPSKQYDIYWCPLPFKGKSRLEVNVIRTKYLWQDLDYANPNYLEDNVKPSIAWESSPGRFHGLWKLDREYKPDEIKKVNRDLSRHVGADKGGWDLTQVLRIPGTHNLKYKEKPEVKLLWDNAHHYNIDSLKEILQTNSVQTPDLDHVALKELDPGGILKKHYKSIPRKALTLLLAKSATIGKRSDIIWYLTNKLNEVGLNPHEVYSLMKNSVWNKYRGRHDEEERLKIEIEKVIEGKIPDDKETKTETGENSEASEDDPFSLRLESYADVMGSISSYPGWLVEGFWSRRSHGIVAGEPKSFKSTYVIDLAVSVASGEPFLGQFPVLEKGPVVYIQNENADWIIRDKMEKVIANRGGLAGEVKIKGDRLKIRFPRDIPLYFINQQGYQINDPIHQQILEKIIKEYKPVLVVFDPLYLMFDGDVNSAKELNPALNWLLHLKNEYRTGIMLIHHYNKGGGGNNSGRGGQRMLGSTTLHGWIESAWYLKHPQKDEDEEDEGEVAKVAGKPTPIILDREFRSAGGFPRIELVLTMGETGDPLYKVDVNKYDPKKGKEGRVELNEEDVEADILNLLEMSHRPVSQRQMSESTGASRRIIKKILDRMSEQGLVNLVKEGAKLIKN